jgi:hypothetical protein
MSSNGLTGVLEGLEMLNVLVGAADQRNDKDIKDGHTVMYKYAFEDIQSCLKAITCNYNTNCWCLGAMTCPMFGGLIMILCGPNILPGDNESYDYDLNSFVDMCTIKDIHKDKKYDDIFSDLKRLGSIIDGSDGGIGLHINFCEKRAGAAVDLVRYVFSILTAMINRGFITISREPLDEVHRAFLDKILAKSF